MAGVAAAAKAFTGLTGLTVAKNPNHTLGVLYSKTLRALAKVIFLNFRFFVNIQYILASCMPHKEWTVTKTEMGARSCGPLRSRVPAFPDFSFALPRSCSTFFCVSLCSCVPVSRSYAPVSKSLCLGVGVRLITRVLCAVLRSRSRYFLVGAEAGVKNWRQKHLLLFYMKRSQSRWKKSTCRRSWSRSR